MLDSIHLARWMANLVNSNHKYIITGTSPYRVIRPELLALCKDWPEKFQIVEIFPKLILFGKRVLPAASFIADTLFGTRIRGYFLARLVDKLMPDCVHVNELIVAGLPSLTALKMAKAKPKVWLTNYGSELVWNQSNPRISPLLRQLLALGDYFSAECERDVALAREMGFIGEVFDVMPVSGGLKVLANPSDTPRTKVVVKGYQNSLGLGARALEVCGRFAENNPMMGISIVAYSCNRQTISVAKKLKRRGIDVEYLKKGRLSHSQMLDLFSQAAVYVGASRSDGISTSVLEAMSQGAIPIQTDTSCSGEWFKNGSTGFLVSQTNLDEIYQALDAFFGGEIDAEAARQFNREVILDRANPEKIARKAIANYEALI